MAVSFKDVESWLPSEKLLMEKDNFNKNGFNSIFNFPTEFPYDSFGSSSSSLSSPDESVVGSNETESGEDDDFLAGLTRRLTLKPEKQWVMSGSPESTLSGIGSWSVSSNGSPNGVLSPPTTPFGAKNDTWDMIYAAAAQVATVKMGNERMLLGSVKTQTPNPALKNQNVEIRRQNTCNSVSQPYQYHSQVRREQVLKSRCGSVWGRQQVKDSWLDPPQPHNHHRAPPPPQSHFHHLQQIQSRNRAIAGYESGRCVRPLGAPHSACSPLEVQSRHHQHHHQPPQQNSVSGMRAVSLGGSSVKRECAGTGVFLPRRYGNTTESQKKTACSSVLLPAKVVQALNLNFEDMNMNNHTFPSDYDVMMARRSALLAQQKRNLRHENVHNLPQEWTY